MFRSPWVIGHCWRCEAADVRVLYLGAVQTETTTGPFYACDRCVRRLEALANLYANPPARTP